MFEDMKDSEYCIKDIINMAKKNKNNYLKHDLLKHLSSFCEKNKIKLSTEKIDDTRLGRLIFSGNIGYNGIVVDSDTWKILVMPPKKYIRNIDGKTELSKFDYVIKIMNGTIVTLYYYDNEWSISTAHGYDVSHITWLSKKSFAQLILEALLANPDFANKSGLANELVEEHLSFKMLDTKFYYTIGFRHEDIHPSHNEMKHPGKFAWFIGSNCDDSKNPIQLLPMQESCDVGRAKTVNDLWKTSPSDYGYMLYGKSKPILLESELMKKLKKYIYNIPKRIGLNDSNRLQFVQIRAFLNDSWRDDFIRLFPQFKLRFENYQRICRSIIVSVVNLITDKKVSDRYYEIAQIIYKKMKDIDAVSTKFDIISNFINPEYTLLFMDLYDSKFGK